jgi:hypothetical protein
LQWTQRIDYHQKTAMNNLKQLVDQLTGSYAQVASRNHCFFVNNIPGDLSLDHNREWIASVISGLLSTVTGHATNTCIQLSARRHGHIIVFNIEESGNTNSYNMAGELKQAFLLAEKIGGCLSISVPVMANTTISFSFPNLPLVAA